MKVYRLTADIDRKYAQIHSQMEQEPKEGITVMWDDWLVKGNIIPDFIFSVYSISKTKIIEDLQNRFNGLEKIKLLWEKNPKEEVAKNIHRLKWLPKEKWHDTNAKPDYLRNFKKEMKGDTNADFYINNDTNDIYLRTNKKKYG